MIEYFFNQSLSINMRENESVFNLIYHINNFDWPIEHGHKDYWEFTIVKKGVLSNYTQSKIETYQENSVFVSTTRDVHRLLSSKKEPLQYVNIMVREKYLYNLLEIISPGFFDYILKNGLSFTLSNDDIEELVKILQKVSYSNTELNQENNDLVCSAFLRLLSYIIHYLTADSIKMPPSLEIVNKLAANNELLLYNVDTLCKKLNYSRTQLNVIFKQYYHQSPHEYLTSYKFNHAKKLLINTNLTIAEIADVLGYSSQMQFYITFKNYYNMSPGKYRKQNCMITQK